MSTETTAQKKDLLSLGREPGDLFGQTLRTVILLVGACVLFVGALSTVAVVITSKAVGDPSSSHVSETDDKGTIPAISSTAKKPVSI
jgi:hypothetical protein